jgi:hypothetical protein
LAKRYAPESGTPLINPLFAHASLGESHACLLELVYQDAAGELTVLALRNRQTCEKERLAWGLLKQFPAIENEVPHGKANALLSASPGVFFSEAGSPCPSGARSGRRRVCGRGAGAAG